MKAQDILNMILESDRYAQSRTFAQFVLDDEPILRTGAEAFAGRDDDADARAGDDAVVDAPSDGDVFSGRVFHDEPIRRVSISDARAARNAARADASGAQASRKAPVPDAPHLFDAGRASTASWPLADPPAAGRGASVSRSSAGTDRPLRGGRMPEAYRRMRALSKKRASWAGRYTTGGSRLFFEQGKLMEDFEDDYAGAEAYAQDFAMYYPTYDEMSDRQLRSYFTWRTHLRAGEVGWAPVSFLFVHAYELLCGIGVEPGERGFEELQRFRAQYEGVSASFDAHLARWSHDYVVDHGLDASLLAPQSGTPAVGAVSVLRRAEEALLSQDGGSVWPDRVPAGWPTSEELLDAMVALSRYRADRSRFFRDHREDVAEVCARVFARMVAHCHKRRKTDLVDGLFGAPSRISYTMYPSALYWSPTLHPDATYEASEAESYVCERGFWWRVLPCRKTDTNRELGALLHAIDARMRLAFGDAHPLKEKSVPKYQGKFVDDEISALLARREAEEAARVRIDLSSLAHIRSASVRTREALLTDEEREDEVRPVTAAASSPSLKPLETVRRSAKEPSGPSATNPSGPSAANQGDPSAPDVANPLGLAEDQAALLRALLAGEALPRTDGMFLSLAVDAINEAFLDVVGDTVIEYDGDEPVLVEDYEQDVRDALA